MTWKPTPFDTDAVGGKTVFPYEDWEERTRLDLTKATSDSGLWHPVIVALRADTDSTPTKYSAAAKYVLEACDPKNGLIASKDALLSLKILADPDQHPHYENDFEILSHMVVYRPASLAKKQPVLSSVGPQVYDTLHIGAAIPRESLRPSLQDAGFSPKGKNKVDTHTVLTAVIDDVIGIANQRFRATPDTTRITHFWKQGLETFRTSGPLPDVVLGREYSKDDIDTALQATVTEGSFYRTLYDTEKWQRFLSLWQEAIRAIRDKDEERLADVAEEFGDLLQSYNPQLFETFVQIPSVGPLQNSSQATLDRFISAYNLLARDYERPMGRLDAHGTAMLDIAAGFDVDNDLGDDKHTKRPIVAVELPSLATLETSGARLDAYVLQAVQRILFWADNHVPEKGGAPKRVPVVINLSYGLTAGSKDGQGMLEQEIQRLVDHRNKEVPTVVVLPAGNTYRSLLNGAVSIGRRETRFVEWRVQPDDFSPSYLEVRMPRGAQFKLTFTPPDGPNSFTVTDDELGPQFWVNSAGSKLNSKAVYVTDEPGTDTTRIVLALAPTKSLETPRHLTQSGTYGVSLENRGSAPLEVRYDVQRDDTPVGYPPFGRQSYLDDDAVDGIDPETKTRRFPKVGSELSFEETLNAIAGVQDSMMVLVGGTYSDNNRPGSTDQSAPQSALYSSSGVGARRPDVSAVTEQGRSLISGVLASGVFSSSVVAISGTSAAAPQATRAIVDLLLSKPRGANAAPWTKQDLLNGILGKTLPRDPRKGAGTLGKEVATDRAGRLQRRLG